MNLTRLWSMRLVPIMLLALLLSSFPAHIPTTAHATSTPDTALAAPTDRWIVQLADAPLAQARLSNPALAIQTAQSGTSRLNAETPAAQAYRLQLAQTQQAFFQAMQQQFPTAQLHRQYQVVLNAIGIALPNATTTDLQRLQALPGVVAVYPDLPHDLHMYSSNDLIGATALWQSDAIGGQANAGAGVKIAVIDSGIRLDNPFFDPTSYSYPEGYPRGEVAYTTPKVIVARQYIRPGAPPLEGNGTPEPTASDSSHGTHVAGIAAGNADTIATLGGLATPIAGVAPRAYLLNYKAFYANTSPFSGSAFSIELIAALEDAVLDGADVINNSWGGRAYERPETNPIAQAADAAAAAGVVVVFSAGNAGPDANTAGSPAYSDSVISVGAATKDRTIATGFVDVIAPADAPDTLRGRPFGEAAFGAPVVGVIGPVAYVPILLLDGSGLACDPLPAGILSGQVALIERGQCPFSLKAFHAQQAGASAAIIYNSAAGGETVLAMAAGDRAAEVFISAIFVPRSMGVGMLDWYTIYGDAAQVRIDSSARIIEQTGDVLTSFSSRGPSFQATLKPDVIAPGDAILSAGFASGIGLDIHRGFGLSSGTSMSGPHVAGGAALLRQLYPTWSTADVKSALMATADRAVWLDADRTQPASVIDQGAGRINLARAANPGLLFDRPSISFGNTPTSTGRPTRLEAVVTARNITNQTLSYRLSARVTDALPFSISVSPSELTLGAQEQGRIVVSVEIPADQAPADYGGVIELGGGVNDLHIPVWIRTLPAEQITKVLLLDNDGSSSLGLRDYSGFYGDALAAQGISTTYLDLDAVAGAEQTLPPLGTLQQFEIIIWFTGDNDIGTGQLPVPTPLTPIDQNLLIAYLQSGGKLIASGQNLADASDLPSSRPDPRYGRSDLFGYLGAQWAADDIFGDAPAEQRIVTGAGELPWTDNLRLNLSIPENGIFSGATGAGNQISVDALQFGDADPRIPPRYTVPFLRVPGTPDGIFVGMQSSDSPTLEKPLVGIPYRTVNLSFGFEGIRDDVPGFTPRRAFLQEVLFWTVDRPQVSLANNGLTELAEAGQTVDFVAQASTNTPARIIRYRWDFGDGTPISETAEASVSHTYAAAGTYQVRVQVTSIYGHSALSATAAVVTGAQAAPLDLTQTSLSFAETGYSISGRFAEYWQQHGGLPVFGFPLETATQSGDAPLTQMFERTRFEAHPANPAPYDVLLGRMGAETLAAQGRDWRNFATVTAADVAPDCLYFAETQHSLCGAFLRYWQQHGLEFDGQAGTSYAESLALFGLPLSEPYQQVLPDGSTITVQWFERARFEEHPQNPEPYRVLLGLLSSEAAATGE